MKLIFVDESGYTPDWRSDMAQQPHYVVSAVCVPAEKYRKMCDEMRAIVSGLGIPFAKMPLGQGFEIKAREIVRGGGWWKDHEDARNAIRDVMLGAPAVYGGQAICIVIDKAKHQATYYSPEDPYDLAHQFLLERMQWNLARCDADGYCVWDQNKRIEDTLHEHSASLIREGSGIEYFSGYFGTTVAYKFKVDRILEVSMGQSEYSVGLNVADFFASMTAAYFKQGRRSSCGWWNVLERSLDRKGGVLDGAGLKVFP
jgi:hypothetical protein